MRKTHPKLQLILETSIPVTVVGLPMLALTTTPFLVQPTYWSSIIQAFFYWLPVVASLGLIIAWLYYRRAGWIAKIILVVLIVFNMWPIFLPYIDEFLIRLLFK